MKIDPKNVRVQKCSLTHLALFYLVPADESPEWSNPLYLGPTMQAQVNTRDPRKVVLYERASAFSMCDRMEVTVSLQKGTCEYELPPYDLLGSNYNQSIIYVPGGVITSFEDLPHKWKGDPPYRPGMQQRLYVKTRFGTFISFVKRKDFEII